MSDANTCVRAPNNGSTTNGIGLAHKHHNHKLQSKQRQDMKTGGNASRVWKVCASDAAINTSNPIREIIETMNLAENPDKKVIPLSIGDPTIFGNLKPCEEILDAIQKANLSGKYYGYQTAAGMESAREAVAEYHFKQTGNLIKSQDVILASGCSHAIDLCICVLARRGQNILIQRPGFPLYKTLTSVYGVHYKQYDLIAERNWSINLEHLESLVDENTAAIVINNPSNPCGSVFSKRHLKKILKLAEKHRLPIIADEIYDKFVFSPNPNAHDTPSRTPMETKSQTVANIENERPHCALINRRDDLNSSSHTYRMKQLCQKIRSTIDLESSLELDADGDTDGDRFLATNGVLATEGENVLTGGYNSETDCDELNEDDTQMSYAPFLSLASLSETVPILTCGGISKTCLIPGLRLGWIIINDKKNIFDQSVRNGLSRLTQRLMGPNSLVQGALHDILTNVPENFYKRTMDFIYQNAKLCYERLLAVRGLQPYMPQGSMYLMVRFDPKVFPTIQGDLDFTSKLMNEESVLVLPGECFDFPNFFRLCLTVPTNVMDEALTRIKEFCERYTLIKDDNMIKETFNPLTNSQQLKDKNHHHLHTGGVGTLNDRATNPCEMNGNTNGHQN